MRYLLRWTGIMIFAAIGCNSNPVESDCQYVVMAYCPWGTVKECFENKERYEQHIEILSRAGMDPYGQYKDCRIEKGGDI